MRKPLAVLSAAVLTLAVSSPAAGDDPAPAPAAGKPDAAALEGAFLPKAETHVTDLLAARPEADGRGVIVAILDTGVDPGHPRLAKTSTGERKLVDFLDATDDGVVDTSIPVDAEDGKLVGATGRALKLGAHRKSGEAAFLGRIDAADVLPDELVSRLKTERRRRHEKAVRRAKEAGGFAFTAKAGEDEKTADARKEAEKEAQEALPDETPAFDVATFVGKDAVRVVIDTDADGDLAEERALTDFSTSGDWTTLRDDCELDVAVRSDADGKHVRLLFDGGGHGTHVAGIVAGYEGPGSPLNGVAPGARVLAIKVGNSRYDGATTNLSILRALDWAGRRGAKVVNLSFGGPSYMADAGTPDARAADDAVERYGLLCCFSAGTEGPALTTIGSPATARRALSVGAYVSPPTMRVSYAQLGDDPGERLFGFSSRGPLPGGDLGISVVAPGAAWSTLPSWTLTRAENWNGTSMAAPQVAGACALLLSVAAREAVPAPPARVIRAIKASARPVEGLAPFEQGAGLLQADRAAALLVAMRDAPEERELRAVVEGTLGRGGGVYERGPAKAPFDRSVRVEVVWPEGVANDARAAFEKRLVLASDRPWIQAPPRVGLNANGGSFALRIDPSALPEGVHSGTVTAIDPARPADGPELSVPVTIVVPAEPDASGRRRDTVTIAPGERASRFVRVPEGAETARLRVVERDGGRNGWTACLSSVDAWRRQDDRVTEKRLTLDAGDAGELSVDVRPGTVLEATLFSAWNANRRATLDLEVAFEGPVSRDARLEAGPGEDVVTLRLATPLAPFKGRVEARIDQTVERPTVEKSVEAVAEPLLGGDRLFTSTQRFHLHVAAEETVHVVPLGDESLDEQREDARWRVIDSAGRVVKKAVIDGPFELEDLRAGEYRVVYETPTWGKAAAEAGLTGFEVRRDLKECEDCKVHPTADLAADAAGADEKVDLPAGGRRSLAIRLPKLEAGRAYRGEVEVKDEGDRVRLKVPLVVDRRTDTEADPKEAEDALVDALKEAAEAVADDPYAGGRAWPKALEQAKRAAALRPDDVDLEILALRLEVAAADPAEAGKAADAARLEHVERLLAARDRTDEDDRPRIGRLTLLRSTLRERAGKAPEAKADLVEARFLLPADDPEVLAARTARGFAAGGDRLDGRAAAKALAKARPTSIGAAERLVLADRELGWAIPAAAELRAWPERFPEAVRRFRNDAGLVRAIGGDPAPRPLTTLGPP